MSALVLRARQIVKTFHDGELETQVLKGIDLDIAAGDFLALMGPSGSGKSTLLAILGTLLRPTSGTLEVAGQTTAGVDDATLTRFRNRHLGFVYQFHHLLPDFTARENVLFPALAHYGRETAAARQRAAALLQRVGLGHRLDYKAAKLSGGQKQRVAVARAVMMKPELVLADEPTGNLDREAAGEVMTLLHEMRDQEGTAFLISTHDPQIAARCDRVIQIVDGRIQS
ncbi:MAG: ABC transporter ATP-binding protein [candidate division KSB1 bacterium]|nr:ABC transporter ATP-binding protein [candidate division KSB1 bacterium]MDZ7275165.1 ABC transporter ATP-binding protein [candidate division KSB1 bacterium]MDZ7287334.1 ABC transporter ATP-binding protein [candidate division KSB1 bacterium]MDZ7299448.1 ABC transporter ATP-binding protein [candidate division KSB1 bacterium]MDZ7305506.1 ABC transporter ATP-binding protein [candidate division KSB1 bacterium]